MQDLSFTFRNYSFGWQNLKLSMMIYSFTNAYSLDPDFCQKIENKDGSFQIQCTGLLTCGGQEKAAGSALLIITPQNQGIRVCMRAQIDSVFEEIRSVRLNIDGLEDGKIISRIDARPLAISEEGIRFSYPEGWRDSETPLLIVQNKKGNFWYAESMDSVVRGKTFVLQKQGNDTVHVELIFEELADRMSNQINVPEWVIGSSYNLEGIYRSYTAHVEQAYSLKPWEKRSDVPEWAKDISLVAAIHGQHWSGYIFNDYEQILENIRWLAARIEPKRILAYIPGWEGRYYWKYGHYCPDERMGGEQGFHHLCDEAAKLGVHLMPMFGINMTGDFDNYSSWGSMSEMRSASGNIVQASVDWDGSRHYDHSSNRNLNPGAPKWQNRLSSQIIQLSKEYGFQAAFLDIAAVWMNDPNFEVYPGVKQLVHRLYEGIPDCLIAGEGWYDGLGAVIPLLQCGHTDGHMHYHDEANSALFDTYCRDFGHLCLGDPSRGSTGVHELGRNKEWKVPFRKGVIPTITIVDGTIQNAPERCEEILQDARKYVDLFLNK